MEFYNKPLMLVEEALRENKNLSACLKQKTKEDEDVIGVAKAKGEVEDFKDMNELQMMHMFYKMKNQ